VSWQDAVGSAAPDIAAMIAQALHLMVSCNACHQAVRMPPTEAADLLGGDCTLIQARDRLRCSWCGARGALIDVRPDTLDMDAKRRVDRAEREAHLWPGPGSYAEQELAEAKAAWEARRPSDSLAGMCNAYRLKIPISVLMDDLSGLGLPLQFAGGATPNWPEIEMTRPTNSLPVFRPVDAHDPALGLQLANLRWWLVPFIHRGPVKDWKAICTNARAETVATSRTFKGPFERRRCLVPADAYYEWTGETGAKTRWRFERADGDWFAFAGIWDRAETADGRVESFSIITTAAGPDSAPYHARQPALLAKPEMARWLDLAADVSNLIMPSAADTLAVVQV